MLTRSTACVVFEKGEGLTAFLVRAWTRQRGQRLRDVPGHVSIVLIDHWDDEPPRAYKIEACAGGVDHEHLALADLHDDNVLCWAEFDIDRDEPAVEWLWHQCGKPYDWDAIFGDLLRRLPLCRHLTLGDVRQDAWDCSRLAFQFLSRIGVRELVEIAQPVTPNDLMRLMDEYASEKFPVADAGAYYAEG